MLLQNHVFNVFISYEVVLNKLCLPLYYILIINIFVFLLAWQNKNKLGPTFKLGCEPRERERERGGVSVIC